MHVPIKEGDEFGGIEYSDDLQIVFYEWLVLCGAAPFVLTAVALFSPFSHRTSHHRCPHDRDDEIY